MKILKPKNEEANIRYAYYYMQTLNISYDTHKRYWISVYAKLNIPLPHPDVQQAIVLKIEELFSEVDKGIETLRTAQQQLKTYRQSVLKWAFEGKLTEEWRKKNTKKVKGTVPKVGTQPNGDLPEGWEWKQLEQLVSRLGDGLHGTPEYSDGGEYWFVNGNNLNNGRIFLKNGTKKTAKAEYDKYKKHLNENSVLVSINGTLGNIAFYNNEKIILGKSICYFNVTELLNKNYIKLLLNSQYFLQYASNEATGSTIKNVSLKTMRSFKVPLTSFEEQQAIVEEIESRLSVADKMEESIATSLQQAEALKQSILKMAFEGRLVSEVEVVREKAITKPSKKSKNIKLPVEVYPRIKEGIAATDLHAGIIAMIVDLHEKHPEHLINLTHVKCEKIAHLVEAKLGISLGRMPVKDAAGPDDFPHLKKVEHRANKCNWLKVIKQDIGYTYQSKSGASKIITKVETVLSSSELNQVKSLMNEFLKFDLERSEVIATVYAGWNNLLILGQQPTDEEIVFESRENWSKRKLLIDREKFFKALIWMRKHGYIPEGKGSLVLKKGGIQKTKKQV